MRWAAILVAVSLLVAGCPQHDGQHTQPMPTGITYESGDE